MIDTKKVDFWLENNLNVLLEGLHGCGKTAVVKEKFEKKYGVMGKDWLYFSASTMDPWVDFIGVPREVKDGDGEPYLSLVRPQALRNGTVKAIFIDEFNRAPKKVRNAIMELVQFKSINGHHFPNLEIVWAAINPHDDNETYDVDRLDPAQLDRFHIRHVVPYEIDRNYFNKKYGEDMTSATIDWWSKLPKEVQKEVSPRRVDYALQIFNLGGSLRADVLSAKANVAALLEKLNGLDRLSNFKTMIKKKKAESTIKEWISDDSNFNACQTWIVENIESTHQFLSPERLRAMASSSKAVRNFLNKGKNKDEAIGAEDEKLREMYLDPEMKPENWRKMCEKHFGKIIPVNRTQDEIDRKLTQAQTITERIKKYKEEG